MIVPLDIYIYIHMGVFPYMVVTPISHPKKCSLFSRKTNPWLLGKPTILGNPPYIDINIYIYTYT